MVIIESETLNYFGHIEYDLEEELFYSNNCLFPENDVKSDFFIGKNNQFVDGILKL